MKSIPCLLVIVLISTLLTGCWGAKEIEHMIYVNTLGIDYVDDQFVVYVQMVNFSGIGKKESGGATQEQKTFVGQARGDSFDTAIFNLYASSPQRIVWSNIKTLVFSDKALKHGIIDQVLEVWDRYYEFRYTVWAMATKEPMEEVLNTPSISDLSVLYSQLNSPMRTYEQSSIIAPIYLYKFIWKWKEKGQVVLLPYLDIVHGWTDNNKPSPNLSMAGVCLLDDQQFKGCLKSSDALGLRWLEKKTIRTPLVIKDKKSVKALMVMNKIKSSIKLKIKRGKPVFDINVSMQATLPQLNISLQKTLLEKEAVKEVKKQIMDTYLNGLKHKADVYSLSGILYRQMPRLWHELYTKEKFPLTPDSIENIHVKVNLVSGGISKMR
ncbi:Ger(x)C family spore germination protein [Paenibacillus guangzhouensis]|uniref:Ger(x)C family spore germination protein n=1 Tax=Paenibacillus guangzhouensis TaxID=1473112 RepID=UPI001266CC03|nr:Ger(x)C family spore germination protein [Paenibacillus guangzhouensis]